MITLACGCQYRWVRKHWTDVFGDVHSWYAHQQITWCDPGPRRRWLVLWRRPEDVVSNGWEKLVTGPTAEHAAAVTASSGACVISVTGPLP